MSRERRTGIHLQGYGAENVGVEVLKRFKCWYLGVLERTMV